MTIDIKEVFYSLDPFDATKKCLRLKNWETFDSYYISIKLFLHEHLNVISNESCVIKHFASLDV